MILEYNSIYTNFVCYLAAKSAGLGLCGTQDTLAQEIELGTGAPALDHFRVANLPLDGAVALGFYDCRAAQLPPPMPG